jgi:hypothetical protein
MPHFEVSRLLSQIPLGAAAGVRARAKCAGTLSALGGFTFPLPRACVCVCVWSADADAPLAASSNHCSAFSSSTFPSTVKVEEPLCSVDPFVPCCHAERTDLAQGVTLCVCVRKVRGSVLCG